MFVAVAIKSHILMSAVAGSRC